MLKKPMCKHGHFCPPTIRFFPTKFSLHFGERTFWWAPSSFSPLPLSTKHPPKSLSSSFSLQNFPSILFHPQTNTPLPLSQYPPCLQIAILRVSPANSSNFYTVWRMNSDFYLLSINFFKYTFQQILYLI